MKRKGRPWKEVKEWPIGFRLCRGCKKLLPYDSFHAHKSCINGVNTECKDCRKLQSKLQWKHRILEKKILDRAKHRAKDKGLDFNLDVNDIIIPEFCPVLKVKLEQIIDNNNVPGNYTPSIDKIDPSKGYVKGNVRIISHRANILKNDATLNEIELVYLDMKNLEEKK